MASIPYPHEARPRSCKTDACSGSSEASTGAGSRRPGCLSRGISRFPVLCMLASLIPIFMSALVVFNAMDEFELDIDVMSYKVEGDLTSNNYDALQASKPFVFSKRAHDITFGALEQRTQAERLNSGLSLLLVFEGLGSNDNLLDEASVKLVRSIETAVLQDEDFQRVCQLDRVNGSCAYPQSLTKVAFASRSEAGAKLVLDGRGSTMMSLDKVIDILLQYSAYGFFDQSFNADNRQSRTLVSVFTTGLPLPGYESKKDREDLQREEADKAFRAIHPKLVQLASDLRRMHPDIAMYYQGGSLLFDEVRDSVLSDLRWAGASFLFAFVYMTLHLRSAVIALAASISLALSFAPAMAVYWYTFGGSITVFAVSSLWIVIGIGSDDVFVLHGFWKQQLQEIQNAANGDIAEPVCIDIRVPQRQRAARLSRTLLQAGLAMLVTSATTAVAFGAGNFSRLLPVRQFSSFMAYLVIANFYLAIVFMPCVLVIHERTFESRRRSRQFLAMAARQPCSPLRPDEIQRQLEQKNAVPAEESASSSPIRPQQTQNIKSECSVNQEQQHPQLMYSIPSSPPQSRTSESPSMSFTSCDQMLPPSPGKRNNQCVEAYANLLYRVRMPVLLVACLGVIYLGSQARYLEAPPDLPALLPSDSNLESLRRLYKDTVRSCDSCWKVEGPTRAEVVEVDDPDVALNSSLAPPTHTARNSTLKSDDTITGDHLTLPLRNLTKTEAPITGVDTIRLCPESCSGHGNCVKTVSRELGTKWHCQCQRGHGGRGCEISCEDDCSGRGTCSWNNPYSPEPLSDACSSLLNQCMTGDRRSCMRYKLTRSCPDSQLCMQAWLYCHSDVARSDEACMYLSAINCRYGSTDVSAKCSCPLQVHGSTCQFPCPMSSSSSSLSFSPSSSVSKQSLPERSTSSACNGHGVCRVIRPKTNSSSQEVIGVECVCRDGYQGSACELASLGPVETPEQMDPLTPTSPPPPPPPLSARDSVHVALVVGITGVEKSAFSSSSVGKPIYDANFDMAAMQLQLEATCAHLRSLGDQELRQDLLNCLFEELPSAMNEWPVPQKDFSLELVRFLASPKGKPFGKQVGVSEDVHLAFWRVNLVTLAPEMSAAQTLHSHYLHWEAVVKELANGVLKSASVFQASETWLRMNVELALVDGASTSCIVAMLAAAVALLVFTRSLIVAFLGTSAVASALAIVGGAMVFLGFTLGIIEAISVSMLVGLAVDYQLHVGHLYMSAPGSRRDRGIHAIVSIGESVFSSAITTAGSAALLIPCNVHILATFGTIVALTALASLFAALVLLPVSLFVIGPEDNQTNKRAATTVKELPESESENDSADAEDSIVERAAKDGVEDDSRESENETGALYLRMHRKGHRRHALFNAV